MKRAGFLAIALAAAGCNDGSPLAPSVPPVHTAPAAPPILTSVVPETGSAAGGTPVVVSGTGLQAGAVVTLGGQPTNAFFHEGALYLSTPPHSPGAVAVQVTNPGSPSATLAAGYTYALPSAFDFNGEWEGGTGPEWATPVRFTIVNQMLVRFSCGNTSVVLPSPAPETSEGEFSVVANETFVTGRITSAGHAVGTVDVAPCGRDSWFARKQR